MTRGLRLRDRVGLGSLAVVMLLAVGSCSDRSPVADPSHGPSRPAAVASSSSSPGGQLTLPRTYQEACARRGATCLNDARGALPPVLDRKLHLPVLRRGERCPASLGRRVDTADFGGVALGAGPVRVVVGSEGDLRRGVAVLTASSAPGWLALKTLWFSAPGYQGPFVIRAKRLDGVGQVGLGEGATVAPLVVPPGPTLNDGHGYRTAPGGLWVKSAGCYGWQVDGLNFSEVLVVKATLKR